MFFLRVVSYLSLCRFASCLGVTFFRLVVCYFVDVSCLDVEFRYFFLARFFVLF